MSPDQVERVAKAFYAAEYSDCWDDAPEIVQNRFREMARTAISLLHEQISHCRLSLMLMSASECPHGKEATRLSS